MRRWFFLLWLPIGLFLLWRSWEHYLAYAVTPSAWGFALSWLPSLMVMLVVLVIAMGVLFVLRRLEHGFMALDGGRARRLAVGMLLLAGLCALLTVVAVLRDGIWGVLTMALALALAVQAARLLRLGPQHARIVMDETPGTGM